MSLFGCGGSNGGVINISGIGIILGNNDNSTETYLRHVRYIADLVGTQHVGLGLDYVFDNKELDEYVTSSPHIFPQALGYAAGIRLVEPDRIPAIAEALLARGWRDAALVGFMGPHHPREIG